MEEIRARLFALQDEKYRDFQGNLTPTVGSEQMIGVRTPLLRGLAKELAGTQTAAAFLNELPHAYFEENQLHAFLIERIRDLDTCLAETERFLPYIDNWATGDQMNPKVFAKHKDVLEERAFAWMDSTHTYTIRYGIRMLMAHFLDADFDIRYPERVANIHSEEYYVQMMVAWYFATALAKQYDAILPFLSERRLDAWVHKKSIQKAVESYRITDEQKAFLKSLR
ncbi:MAG: DNA alkylation repair protein [Lachnospiraceae bacterium]|nr:DNA alkylation repair protein [Lachnospiraceae bacterium]